MSYTKQWWGLLLVAGLLPGVRAEGLQAPAEITAAASAAAEAAVAADGVKVRATADSPDDRLRLPHCDQPLRGVIPAGSHAGPGRVTVEVKCAGARPWRLFVPVQVSLLRPVVIAAKPLARDAVLTPADVKLAEREVGSLDYGYLGDLNQAIGTRVRRATTEGIVLTPSMIDAPLLIRRGQSVSLDARTGGLAVSMAGVAQDDGSMGDTIKVRNSSSGRILMGVVRSAKSVEVLLR